MYLSEGGMASSTRAAQFMKALTRIAWRVVGRRTSLRLVQCTKANSGISSTLVLQRSTLLSSRQLSHACAPIATKCIGRASAVIPVELRLFFHEYGRRVGMVPRSSLKGGKNSLMVEKITRTTTTTQKPQPKAHRPSLHHHVVFPLCKVKQVRRKRVSRRGPELTNEKHIGAGLCSSKVARRLQKDRTSQL